MMTIVVGDDTFRARQAVQQHIQAFVTEHGHLALERLDAEEVKIEHIFDAIQSVPLLSNRKMVVVQRASASKDLLDKLADTPDLVPETTELLLVDSKFDKRARYYKQLSKVAEVKEFTAAGADVTGWLTDYATQNGGTLTRSDAAYLQQRVGGSKTLLANEVDKLIAYDPTISRQSIDLLCEPLPQSSVFQLLDAAFGGQTDRALRLYEEQRQQRVEPQAILGMIAWQLNIMALTKTGDNKDVETIAKDAKLNPFVARKSNDLTKKLSLLELRKLVRRALELDVKLKSTPIDADEGVRYFLLSLGS